MDKKRILLIGRRQEVYFDYTNGQIYQERLLSGFVESSEHIITAGKKLLKQGPNFIVIKINNDEFFLQRIIVN